MSLHKRRLWAFVAIAIGVVIAGFWNYQWVDGFGRDIIAGQTIGDTESLAPAWNELGSGFGFLFAAIAGMAATFTACNCVVFAMLPGLACSTSSDSSPWKPALKALGVFTASVVVISFVYGWIVGGMGMEHIVQYNERDQRILQAQITFTIIGIVMMIWGWIALGFFRRSVEKIPQSVRQKFASPLLQAGLLGILVGLFSVGRPFPVFRHFLEYAAAAGNPVYGGLVMVVQGLGQIIVLVLLFLLILWLFSRPLTKLAQTRPERLNLLSGNALLAGGAFFVFYWGLAFAFDIGRWGFKLNWYG